jgi:uncharacterized protein YndB with AHSA1/START domain
MLHGVEIQAPPETVYEAVSTQQGLAGFWTADNDTRAEVGSVARFGFPDAPVDLKMRVDQLEPGRRIVWSCLGDFPHWKGTTVRWDLRPKDGSGTMVLFQHAGWGEDYPDEEFAGVNFVWGQVVGRLKAYAETGRPQPFFG